MMILSAVDIAAGNRIAVMVQSANGDGIPPGVVVTLLAGDSIVYVSEPGRNGTVLIDSVSSGKYVLEADALGYDLYRKDLQVAGDMDIHVSMTEVATTLLDEVTVSADKSELVTRTANGQMFYLSKEARRMSNPFFALREIPILISDPSTSSVTTIDGVQPLILINGNRVNSGIAPVMPSEIESVEVITNPSARYSKDGIQAVVNIKLKEKRAPYQWYELATRHEIPLSDGFGVGYFEVGNPRISLYGRAAVDYKYHQDSHTESASEDVGYKRRYAGDTRLNGGNVLGELLLKGNPTERDYYAVQIYYTGDRTKSTRTTEGILDTDNDIKYRSSGYDRNRSHILTAGAYYKRTFDNGDDLELMMSYNYNRNKLTSDETYGYGTQYNTDEVYTRMFDNTRNSASVSAEYNKEFGYTRFLGAGARVSLSDDRVEHVHDPYSLFRHRRLYHNAYISWAQNFWGRVWLSVSAGYSVTWLKADIHRNHYARFLGTARINWNINNNNSLSVYYQQNNTSPQVSQLNPFDTSTDPLVINRGNPYLRPENYFQIPVKYTFNYRRLYVSPSFTYCRYSHNISSSGYTDDEGRYVSTYVNSGTYAYRTVSATVGYSRSTFNVSVTGKWSDIKYSTLPWRDQYSISANASYKIGKIFVLADMYYTNRSWDRLGHTDNIGLSSSGIQLNYFFTDDFYVAARLQNFTGDVRTRTYVRNGTYTSVLESVNKESGLRPWILVRYTFRKNQKQKIRLEKVLESTEKGIHLK